MKELKLVSPIPPSVNHYMGIRTIIKNGRPIALTYKTQEARKYQKDFTSYVKNEARNQGWIMSENKNQHYYMDCVFYFDRTDKDANNSFKCMADAITDSNSVWIDDTQLCERVQGIYYDKENPRIEITIKEVDYCGIFQNQDYMNSFEDKCKTCSRYKRNCSILKKAKEGRIQGEIHNYECIKYKGM